MEQQDLSKVMSEDLDLAAEVGKAKKDDRVKKRKREATELENPLPTQNKGSKKRSRSVGQEDEEVTRMLQEKMLEQQQQEIKDPIPRRKKIQKIEAWFATFPSKLEKIRDKVDLESMEEVELDTLLMEIKQIMGSSGGNSLGEMVPLALLTLYEAGMTGMGVRVEGISQLAFDPNFSQACKEVMLEFSDMTYIPPHYRILFILANTTYHLHDKNSQLKGTGSSPTPSNTDPKWMDKEMIEEGKNYLASKNSS